MNKAVVIPFVPVEFSFSMTARTHVARDVLLHSIDSYSQETAELGRFDHLPYLSYVG